MGSWATGEDSYPVDIAFDNSGAAYVLDKGLNRIAKFTSNGEIHQATGISGMSIHQMMSPLGIAIGAGNSYQYLYVTDTNNHRIKLYEIVH